MAISCTGKVFLSILAVAIIAGVITAVVLLVQDGSEPELVLDPPEQGSSTEATSMLDPSLETGYDVGVGIADMTGPCVEINFMGYADLGQTGQGIHLRQFSRAFIFVQGNKRIVYVSAEAQSIGYHVRKEVVKNLQALYGDMYNIRNVIITGTHTHSVPGGYLVDFLLDISILGFSSETFDAYVDGITRSIVRAHENIVPARLFFAQTQVMNANMNRSPYSYEYNPPEERSRYPSNTDTTLSQLRIERADGSLLGVLSWFPVHTTSMNMTNALVSSDNLGAAALMMERALNPNRPAGKPEIVAAFFAANLGDVSPNTRGARCEFSGEECDNQFTICDAGERCYAQGPGEDMFQSTWIIGKTVFEGALEALSQPGEELHEHIAVVHQFVDMPEEVVPRYDSVDRTFDWNSPVKGCVPGMGYSFASGTIDGANTLNITQGTIVGNPLLDTVSGIIGQATAEDIECHAPKPILLATGRANVPLPWHSRVMSVSLIYLGGVTIACVPGEPTTMSGRRIRDVISQAADVDPDKIMVSGLANEYSHYVATFEEYQIQRYEAASTLYGPHTLNIYLHKFAEFIKIALENGDVEPGPEPEDNRNRTISLILPVVYDGTSLGSAFGDVIEQPSGAVRRGDTVEAIFVGANPRNDLRHESTYLVVERLELGQWITVATDADWETKFTWQRLSTLTATSQVIIEWTVPEDILLGSYRIKYFGAAKSLTGTITSFEGVTNTFSVTA